MTSRNDREIVDCKISWSVDDRYSVPFVDRERDAWNLNRPYRATTVGDDRVLCICYETV